MCPDGMFGDKADNKCKLCNEKCETCEGPNDNNCLSCKFNGFLLENKCVGNSSCPKGYYGNTLSRKCEKCDPTCETCNGGKSSNCLTCLSG